MGFWAFFFRAPFTYLALPCLPESKLTNKGECKFLSLPTEETYQKTVSFEVANLCDGFAVAEATLCCDLLWWIVGEDLVVVALVNLCAVDLCGGCCIGFCTGFVGGIFLTTNDNEYLPPSCNSGDLSACLTRQITETKLHF